MSHEVIIDGVRYVPAVDAAAGLVDLRAALIRTFWGARHVPTEHDGRHLGVFIDHRKTYRINHQGEDLKSIDDLIADIAVQLQANR